MTSSIVRHLAQLVDRESLIWAKVILAESQQEVVDVVQQLVESVAWKPTVCPLDEKPLKAVMIVQVYEHESAFPQRLCHLQPRLCRLEQLQLACSRLEHRCCSKLELMGGACVG